MKDHFQENRNGDFTIQTYGHGDPVKMCVGGLASAPSDYRELAARLDGTTHVLNNPIHTRDVKRAERWQDWLHEEYIRLFQELGAQHGVGHSGGGVDLLKIAPALESKGLKSVTMIAPPFTKPSNPQESRYREYGLVDMNLALVCKDLPDELYLAVLRDHYAQYGNDAKEIYKKELPPLEKAVKTIIEDLRNARHAILLLIGEQDPWYKRQAELLQNHYHISITTLPEASHYLQVSEAQACSESMNDFYRRVAQSTPKEIDEVATSTPKKESMVLTAHY